MRIRGVSAGDRTAGLVSIDFEELRRLQMIAAFRALPWYRRAWLTLTGKAPR